jgi:hypothetical protein
MYKVAKNHTAEAGDKQRHSKVVIVGTRAAQQRMRQGTNKDTAKLLLSVQEQQRIHCIGCVHVLEQMVIGKIGARIRVWWCELMRIAMMTAGIQEQPQGLCRCPERLFVFSRFAVAPLMEGNT